jgi:hypothetical protein
MTLTFTECQCGVLTRRRCGVSVPVREVVEVCAVMHHNGHQTWVEVYRPHMAEAETLHGITWTNPHRKEVKP